jgi:hypothetical protein
MALDFGGGVPAGMTRESIALFAKYLANPDIRKAITLASGPQAYDLEPEVKSLFPVNTPLRNQIPRFFSKARGDVQTHWQAVTAINTGVMPLPVNEGRRAGAVQSQFVSRTARYATLGLEDSVTEEARLAAQSYDDVDSRTVANLIWATMIGEEIQYLGGNNSYPLGTTNTPSLSSVAPASGQANSSLTSAQTIYVKVVALTLEGYNRALRNGGVPVPQISRTVVGSTLSAGPVSETLPGGVAQISAEASQAVGTNNYYINASVALMAGAVAYVWYVGTAAGAELLYGTTTINSIQIGSVPSGTQAASALPASDNSAYNNSPVGIDGIIPVIVQGSLGGVYSGLPTGTIGIGTVMTTVATSISQIDALLLQMWNNNQIGPDDMWVNAQELGNLTNHIFPAGGTNQVRFAMDVANQRTMNAQQFQVAAGITVGLYLNKFGIGGPQLINVKLHPNVPPGTIVFTTRRLPYPNTNVPDIMRVRGQLDYHEIAWGPFTRSAEYGVYLRCTLQIYAPFSMAVLSNLGNG